MAEMNPKLRPYVRLIDAFCRHEIGGAEFERQYLLLFKTDDTDWANDEFEVLDGLFAAVDAFCADPSLREDGDLDENQLQDACKGALLKLEFRGQFP